MHVFEKNIKDLGYIISEPPDAVANYVPFKIVENLKKQSENTIEE